MFIDRKFTFTELLAALKRDFAGDEALHAYLVNRAPKYGSEDPIAVKNSHNLLRFLFETYNKALNLLPLADNRFLIAYGDQAHVDAQWERLAYTGRPDFGNACWEYERFLEVLRQFDFEMHFAPADQTTGLDSVYAHDPLIVTARGAILNNMGKPARVPEAEALGGGAQSIAELTGVLSVLTAASACVVSGPPLDRYATLPELIGRSQELHTLEQALHAASRGAGCCILLTGEAGIGKSRLIAEFASGLTEPAARWLVLQGACSPYDDLLSYGPFLEAFQDSAAGGLPDLPPELDPSLPDTRSRFTWRVLQTIRSLTHSQPLLLIIEDLQCESPAARRRKLRTYGNAGLVCIDEVGYLSYDDNAADLLYEVINRRYERKSVIVTTNRPFKEWNEVFPNAACIATLLDRLLHHAITLNIRGNSYRLKDKARTLEIDTRVERGGDVTYHGPGQLVGYPIMTLRTYKQDVGWFVGSLAASLVRALAERGICGEYQSGAPGVWVGNEKIAAIGARIEQWISYHGFALNVDPDMSHWHWIVPCGISDRGVTSIKQLTGAPVHVTDMIEPVVRCLGAVFGVEMRQAGSGEIAT